MAFLGSEQVLLELLLSWADWFAQKSGGWQSSRNKVAFRYTVLARKGDNSRESPLDRQKIAWASGGPFKNVTLTLASTEFEKSVLFRLLCGHRKPFSKGNACEVCKAHLCIALQNIWPSVIKMVSMIKRAIW